MKELPQMADQGDAKVPANMKGPFLYGEDKVTETIEKDYYIDIYLVTKQH